MTCICFRPAMWAALTAIVVASASVALAQDGQSGVREGDPSPFNLFGRVFGPSERLGPSAPQAAPSGAQLAQAPGGDLVVRLDRLENQIRQLTGLVEQLQYRNQQLELQLRRVEEADPRLQGSVSRPPVPGRPAAAPPAVPPQAPGRRGDAFDPAANPTAPGAPRVLGSNAASGPPPARAPEYEEPPVAPPAGRGVGAPLDLSTLAGNEPAGTAPPGVSDAGPPRSPGAGGAQVATLPPTDSPKDNYDLGYGYFLRKDYALSEESFRAFLKKYPTDRLAADAQFWLGESLFQRQRWRDAAEAFLNVSTKFEANPKAPDALLRLGQALSALGEKEAACASLGEILRKYPRASVSVKQSVDREQKRVHC